MTSSSTHLLGKPVDELTGQTCRFKVSCSAIKSGNWVWFPAFTTGDHFWRISCGPGIFEEPHEGEVSSLTFYLNYAGECKDVKVSFDLGLFKKNEASTSVVRKTTVHTFPMHGNFCLLEMFVQGNELKRCLKDDYLIVTCNITILSATCMGTSDFGVIILSSLIGISQNHPIEVQSLEDEGLGSKSLTDSMRAAKTEMPSGLFKFKVGCSHIKAIKSFHFPIFMVGENCWQMGFYYDEEECYLSLWFDVHSAIKDIKVSLEFGVCKKGQGSSSAKWQAISNTFEKCGESIYIVQFIEGDELNSYLQDDYLIVICNITILSETITLDHDVSILGSSGKPKSHSFNGPSPYLQDHLRKLLQNKERSDVTFDVNKELFHAHKLILATRSPVFNARLFGPMNENNTKNIEVNEIEPMIFKAMLHFIYTDVLPDLDDGCSENGESNQMNSVEILQHLMVATDHYALDRLKWMCEEKLSKFITVDTVGTTLALAEQHNCPNLKAQCLEFAAMPQNFMRVAITDGYRHLLLSCPEILKELEEKLNIVMD